MSTEQDNFAGMTAQQKVKALVLLHIRSWGNEVEPITKETLDEVWDSFADGDCEDTLRDAVNDIRGGQVETGFACPLSRHFEAKSVGAKLPDGSWVGWTYWYGGGKHSYPQEIEWMPEAYDLTCAEEQKLVTVRSFAKVGA